MDKYYHKQLLEEKAQTYYIIPQKAWIGQKNVFGGGKQQELLETKN